MNKLIGYIPEINKGPITIHLISKIDPDTQRGYFGICTTYPHQQYKRWGLIKDLKYQKNGQLLFISDEVRSQAITFLIAFSSIHHSHKNIVTVTNSEVIKGIIEVVRNGKKDILDIIETIRKLEDRKRTISKLRPVEDYDLELIELLEVTLEKFIENDRNKFYSRSSI